MIMWSDEDVYRALVRLQAKLVEVRYEIASGDSEQAHTQLFSAQLDLSSMLSDFEVERGFVYSKSDEP